MARKAYQEQMGRRGSETKLFMEECPNDQLYHYFTENRILSRYQSGFRSLHSTVTALLEATDSWQ